MLANALIRLGFTRDSATWLWTRLVTLALIISTGLVDLTRYGVTDAEQHYISIAAALILFFAGKYDSSPLPGRSGPPG